MMAIGAFACALLIAPLTTREGTDGEPRSRPDQQRRASDRQQAEPRSGFDPARGGTGADVTLPTPKPREPWGQSIDWPAAWQKPPKQGKD
jgi:hypothetical protein